MDCGGPAVLMTHGACIAVLASILVGFSSSPVNAQQPPWQQGCRVASKTEYNAAKRQGLLTNRFGTYVRTGRFWRRYYWYCR